ncbi:DUF4357 domain-containing protein [Deinococcus psychrotolerans]|uniref:DUF4357 domain-containing protein n=1 Tax=Deinococcus psychrotolerans TaxID=2489213 RepID=A0A3G8YQ44_9DEIO|nr:DUF4357 domain-containing protein [Deinococcus psychrotolerans]AZI43306.1 DUF4357 domain-containing protein [Deinococcus psychrotolerans]
MPAEQTSMRRERVTQVVKVIQHWLSSQPSPGEAVVRQAIVLPLLQAAGFDIWNPAEVIPEETDKGGFRPDLRVVAGQYQFVLELKGMNVGLHDKDYQQVAAYAGGKGIRWALLTDGRVWVVIDEHMQGPYSERIVLKLELVQKAAGVFADDLAAVLDAVSWMRGEFETRLSEVQQAQQKRRDDAQIHLEKRPIVEDVQSEYDIASFEKAAAAAVKMGLITEAERNVLLGAVQIQSPSPAAAEPKKLEIKESKWQLKTQPNKAAKLEFSANKPSEPTPPLQTEICFRYRPGHADAQAVYLPELGKWVIQAGSMTSAEVKEYAASVGKRRTAMLEAGEVLLLEDGRLRYLKNVEYTSPSTAADDISGASKNGWIVWMDEQGRPAQYYRPPKG